MKKMKSWFKTSDIHYKIVRYPKSGPYSDNIVKNSRKIFVKINIDRKQLGANSAVDCWKKGVLRAKLFIFCKRGGKLPQQLCFVSIAVCCRQSGQRSDEKWCGELGKS